MTKYKDDVGELDVEESQDWDQLSSHCCSQCGARMTKSEYEEFEGECGECVYEDTAGLIDDDPEQEL